jgi:hypothetical protein
MSDNTSKKFRLCIANTLFSVEPLSSVPEKYCKEFLCESVSHNSESEIQIKISEADFENTKRRLTKQNSVFSSTDSSELSDSISESNIELLSLHKMLSEKLLSFDTILFHGSSINVINQKFNSSSGIIFTAPSGTGKSTHAEKWVRLFCDSQLKTEYINDDKPFIKVSDSPKIFGSPWMGKHHRGKNTSAPLKAICIITRSETNYISPVSQGEAFSEILKQTYIPRDSSLLSKTISLVNILSKRIRVFRIFCNTSDDAAHVALKSLMEHGIL